MICHNPPPLILRASRNNGLKIQKEHRLGKYMDNISSFPGMLQLSKMCHCNWPSNSHLMSLQRFLIGLII